MKRFSFLILVLCLFLSEMAMAMRCGSQLVSEGDEQYTVLSKCGEPLDKEMFEQTTPVYNYAGYQIGTNTTIVERWIYQKSSADFQYVLIFDQGIVKEIQTNRNQY
ncbi:MAG: DUF2845 domain-containing protein [Legionella sp.]|nr:MAG: DUF2845 domain-containing protein [Legionella sp.]